MKKIVGVAGGVGYELDRVGDGAPAIGQKGSASWGAEGVSGFARVEAVDGAAPEPHLFCEWDEGLDGFWARPAADAREGRWICAARAGSGVQWLMDRMDPEYDGLGRASGSEASAERPSVPWASLAVDDSDKFLLLRMGQLLRLVHARNAVAVLDRSHASLAGLVVGDARWIFGRASIDHGGAPIPVANAAKPAWDLEWGFGRDVGAALVMPYELGDGSTVKWCALLREPPRMMGRREIDALARGGAEVSFVNERALLAHCLG